MAHWRGERVPDAGKAEHRCLSEAAYVRDWLCGTVQVSEATEADMSAVVEDWPEAVPGAEALYEVYAGGAVYRIVACGCDDNV